MRDTERQRHRQREKQAPCREPNARLDPRTLGSCPEPKADTQPLSQPGVSGPQYFFCPFLLVPRPPISPWRGFYKVGM